MYEKKVLVVLGGYTPELAGGGKQVETLINFLKKKIDFIVLSYSKNLENNLFKKKKNL